MATAITASLLGGWLGGRFSTKRVYLAGLAAGLVSMLLRFTSQSFESNTSVAIAVEIRHPKGFGRVRMQRVEAIRKEYLMPLICRAVEPGATIHSDGNQAYWTVPEHGYEHERTVLSQHNDPALMPGVHRVASLLERWLLGTHKGKVGLEHLDAYLNEFTSRFNRRSSAVADCCSTGSSTRRS